MGFEELRNSIGPIFSYRHYMQTLVSLLDAWKNLFWLVLFWIVEFLTQRFANQQHVVPCWMCTLNRNSIPSISASDFEVFRAAKMARNPRMTTEPLLCTPTSRKRKSCSFPFSTPSMGYRENTKVYSFIALQPLNESALIAFLAATMSFFEPLQVPLRSLFEKIIKKSRFSDLFFLNQIFEFFNSLSR